MRLRGARVVVGSDARDAEEVLGQAALGGLGAEGGEHKVGPGRGRPRDERPAAAPVAARLSHPRQVPRRPGRLVGEPLRVETRERIGVGLAEDVDGGDLRTLAPAEVGRPWLRDPPERGLRCAANLRGPDAWVGVEHLHVARTGPVAGLHQPDGQIGVAELGVHHELVSLADAERHADDRIRIALELGGSHRAGHARDPIATLLRPPSRGPVRRCDGAERGRTTRPAPLPVSRYSSLRRRGSRSAGRAGSPRLRLSRHAPPGLARSQ